jgi:ankyrin repeat protein
MSSVPTLHEASRDGNLEVVKELIKAGADINKYENDTTPMYHASENGRLDVVKELVKAGADVNKGDKFGVTPLHIASLWGRMEVVSELLNAGADINKANEDGETPLYWAIDGDTMEAHDVAIELVKLGADVNKGGTTSPLKFASDHVVIDVVKELMNAGGDVYETEVLVMTPLCVASFYGNLEAVKELVKSGADVDEGFGDDGDLNGMTPIYVASSKGHLDVVKELVNAGASVNKQVFRDTPLNIASGKGHLEVVKELVKAGAHVNVIEVRYDYMYPLHSSIQSANRSVAIFLFRNGAELRCCDDNVDALLMKWLREELEQQKQFEDSIPIWCEQAAWATATVGEKRRRED